MKFSGYFRVVWLSVLILLWAEPALATQAHGEPEGLYAHQLGHLFFIVSMGVLIFWLRERQLVQAAGWRYIQYAAVFFILWNVDAFFVHLVDEQFVLIETQRISLWDIKISSHVESITLIWLYYVAKLDHLLCVPALLFLYFGLRRLLKDSGIPTHKAVRP